MTTTNAASTWTLRVCALANAAPLLLSSHLPFCDLPEHVAVIATLRAWNDPVLRTHEQYTIDHLWRTPYVLFHLIGTALSFVLGSAERATLFMLLLTAIAYPYALRSLLVALDRDERFAVVGAMAFWTRSLAEGLVNYVASVPVAVFTLALAVRQIAAPSRRRAIALVALTVATFYLHISSFLIVASGSVVIAFLAPADDDAPIAVRDRLRRAAWIVVPAVVAVVSVATSVLVQPDRAQGPQAGVVRFAPAWFRAHELWGWMHDFWRSKGDDLAGVVVWLAIVACVFRRSSDGRELRQRRLGAALLAIPAAIYFMGPSQVSFAFLLDVRMATYVLLFAALITARRPDARTSVAAVVASAAVFVLGVHGSVQMHRYEREEAAHFDVLMRRLRPRRRLVALVFQTRSERTVVTPFVHFGAYYRIRYGGIASFSFAELPYWPVRYRPEIAPPRKWVTFWDWAPCMYRNTVDGPYYDYVLTRGDVDPFRGAAGPRWIMIGALRDWRLYERTGESIPGNPADDHGPCADPAGASADRRPEHVAMPYAPAP